MQLQLSPMLCQPSVFLLVITYYAALPRRPVCVRGAQRNYFLCLKQIHHVLISLLVCPCRTSAAHVLRIIVAKGWAHIPLASQMPRRAVWFLRIGALTPTHPF